MKTSEALGRLYRVSRLHRWVESSFTWLNVNIIFCKTCLDSIFLFLHSYIVKI